MRYLRHWWQGRAGTVGGRKPVRQTVEQNSWREPFFWKAVCPFNSTLEQPLQLMLAELPPLPGGGRARGGEGGWNNVAGAKLLPGTNMEGVWVVGPATGGKNKVGCSKVAEGSI